MEISVIDFVPTVVDPVWIKTVGRLNYLELVRENLSLRGELLISLSRGVASEQGSPDLFGLPTINRLKSINLSNLPPWGLPVCDWMEEYGRLKASFPLCHDLQKKSRLCAFLQSLLQFLAQVSPFPLVILVSRWLPHFSLLSFGEQPLEGRNSFWDKPELAIVLFSRIVGENEREL